MSHVNCRIGNEWCLLQSGTGTKSGFVHSHVTTVSRTTTRYVAAAIRSVSTQTTRIATRQATTGTRTAAAAAAAKRGHYGYCGRWQYRYYKRHDDSSKFICSSHGKYQCLRKYVYSSRRWWRSKGTWSTKSSVTSIGCLGRIGIAITTVLERMPGPDLSYHHQWYWPECDTTGPLEYRTERIIGRVNPAGDSRSTTWDTHLHQWCYRYYVPFTSQASKTSQTITLLESLPPAPERSTTGRYRNTHSGTGIATELGRHWLGPVRVSGGLYWFRRPGHYTRWFIECYVYRYADHVRGHYSRNFILPIRGHADSGQSLFPRLCHSDGPLLDRCGGGTTRTFHQTNLIGRYGFLCASVCRSVRW